MSFRLHSRGLKIKNISLNPAFRGQKLEVFSSGDRGKHAASFDPRKPWFKTISKQREKICETAVSRPFPLTLASRPHRSVRSRRVGILPPTGPAPVYIANKQRLSIFDFRPYIIPAQEPHHCPVPMSGCCVWFMKSARSSPLATATGAVRMKEITHSTPKSGWQPTPPQSFLGVDGVLPSKI
jgi:hypothetical protein